MARARSGNAAAQAVLPICARALHRHCFPQLHFAPEVVALGGGISEAGDFLLDACHTTLAACTPTPAHLRLAAHRNTAGIIGGAIASLKLGVTMH
ncbi:MAG: ROK family protein [Subdoligranulum sp.]